MPTVRELSRIDTFGLISLEVDLKIENGGNYAVKDIVLTCMHEARSGTVLGSSTYTFYELLPPRGWLSNRALNMGVIHSQARSSSCKVTDFVRLW